MRAERDIDILRIFLRESARVIREVAITPSAAHSQGLALMTPNGEEGSYVLYDQDKVVNTLLDMSGETSRTLSRAIASSGAVVGMMTVYKSAQCWEARTVMSVASTKGYGPLLYDAAMSDGPLAPMRDSVSWSAEKVWKYYYESRPDVAHEPLGQRCRKHVKVRPWLNFKYTLNGSAGVDQLKSRHEGTLKELSYDFSRPDVESALMGAADAFFDSHYKSAA